jgi:hypothetical protein
MQDLPSNHLELISQLAREYEQKYREIEEFIQNAQPDLLLQQLKLRSELATDRFRGAQQFLMNTIQLGEKDEQQTLRALITLVRCFDEMRILFEVLQDHCSRSRQAQTPCQQS